MSDEISSLTSIGHTDDGSDESIATPIFAEKDVLHGIAKRIEIHKIESRVASKEGEFVPEFSFFYARITSLIVFQLTAGPLAMVTVTFLVADGDFAAEQVLDRFPVLQQFDVDSRTLLEKKRDLLNGINCTSVRISILVRQGGYVSGLMVSDRNNFISFGGMDKYDWGNPCRVNYYNFWQEGDTFFDPSALDPVGINQHGDVLGVTKDMTQTAVDKGFPKKILSELLEIIISDHINILWALFFSASPS